MNELEELDDFELSTVSYEVWVTGYDQFDLATDFEILIGSFIDPDAAVDRARTLSEVDIAAASSIPDNLSYFNIEVDTVVSISAGEVSGVGIIYRRALPRTRPSVDIWIKETDYELTESGNLRVVSDVCSKYEIGAILCINMIGMDNVLPFTVKIINKEPCAIVCEFID